VADIDYVVKAVFFDIRDTLGTVDRPGHLIKFKPTTDQLLQALRDIIGVRIGVITNLPQNVSSETGKQMLADAGILPFLDAQGFVTNHDVGVEKPHPGIFAAAAARLGLRPDQCLFCGENLIEVLAAETAGMRAVVKPFPPGRDFLRAPIPRGDQTSNQSGRLIEAILEEEHIVGKRIVIAAAAIVQRLADPPVDGQPPLRAMSLLVWLTQHFIDKYHHRKEEEVLIPFALARGLDPAACEFVEREHEQGRQYFAAMQTALDRIRAGDRMALQDFRLVAETFVNLYREHARKEDDLLFKQAGDLLLDVDDALLVELMSRIGPVDVTLYYSVIEQMEAALQ
jgi:HAD superfamily hydrolase (TIGR01509 family)